MNSFNLLVSSNKDYVEYAMAELWFQLMYIGDDNAIIAPAVTPGLILVDTAINSREVIRKFREIIESDPSFFHFVLKVVPIDRVVEADVDMIVAVVKELIDGCPEFKEESTYAIQVKRRASNITPDELINIIAPIVRKPVNLKTPDWKIRIEILGPIAGVSLLRGNEVLHIIREKRRVYRGMREKPITETLKPEILDSTEDV